MKDIAAELAAATAGLLYPSESDKPFKILTWPASPGQTPRQAVEQHVDGKQPIVEQAVDEFFADMANTDDAERYAAVRTLLAKLKTPAVYRVGKIRVDVYLIGRDDMKWVGLQTLSIET